MLSALSRPGCDGHHKRVLFDVGLTPSGVGLTRQRRSVLGSVWLLGLDSCRVIRAGSYHRTDLR
jgi:hypothetical protein